MKVTSIPLGDITVKSRVRKEMGDIEALAHSISAVGLLHPLVVDSEYRLISGERRLRAARKLKWDKIPVHVAKTLDDAAMAVLAEHDENTCRKEFAPSEAVDMGVKLEKIEQPKAEERRKETQGRPSKTGGKLPPVSADKDKTRDKVGKAVGMSGRTYEKAKAVVDSGDKELIAEMDETGKIDQAYRKAKKKKDLQARAAKATEKPASKLDTPCEWSVVLGDCLVELKNISKARLIFADPPYNIGINYGQGKESDNLHPGEFFKWTKGWLNLAIKALAPDGSLWVLINDEWADYVSVYVRENGLHRRAWIKWYETFGVNCAKCFNRTSRHLLYFVANQRKFVWNESAVLTQSARAAKYNDSRASADGNKIMDDVWQIPRLTGTCKERIPGVPTQIPEEILRRVIGCASNPGDLVVDPFNGSGTTGVIAKRLGRRYIGIEKEVTFWEAAKLRIAAEGY